MHSLLHNSGPMQLVYSRCMLHSRVKRHILFKPLYFEVSMNSFPWRRSNTFGMNHRQAKKNSQKKLNIVESRFRKQYCLLLSWYYHWYHFDMKQSRNMECRLFHTFYQLEMKSFASPSGWLIFRNTYIMQCTKHSSAYIFMSVGSCL